MGATGNLKRSYNATPGFIYVHLLPSAAGRELKVPRQML